jgi:hypothetical protein
MTVAAMMCHSLGVSIAQAVEDSLPEPVCREELVIKNDIPMQSCMLSQAALADWKERWIYRGDQWSINLKCVGAITRRKSAASRHSAGRKI